MAMLTSKAGGYVRPGVEVDSTTLPPPSAVPAPSTFPAPAEPKSSSVFVPGFGRKGEGKTANDGVAIAPPTLLAEADLPPGLQQPSSASGIQGGEAHKSEPLIPPPIPATSEEVEHWMSSCFKPLTNISTKNPPEVGESILWRGVKTGRSGQPSTKCEYFNGKVRHIAVEPDDHELYVYID